MSGRVYELKQQIADAKSALLMMQARLAALNRRLAALEEDQWQALEDDVDTPTVAKWTDARAEEAGE